MSKGSIAAAAFDGRLRMSHRWGRPSFGLMSLTASALGILVGFATALGHARLLAAGLCGLALLTVALVWPEGLLIGWLAAVLADGRWLTYHKIGPLYLTEPLLALIVLGLVLRSLARGRDAAATGTSSARRFLLSMTLVVWVPGVVGLLTQTHVLDYASLRNFVLILYSVFALIAASMTVSESYRRWFIAIMVASAIALLLVVSGHAGSEAVTSTGAIRYAAHTFALAFGIAPLVLIAAAREGVISRWLAVLGAAPFLVGLVFVNHRSAWLAFIAAAVVVLARRLSPPVVVGGLAAIVTAVVMFSVTPSSENSTFGQEVTRAKTTLSTSDPNAKFRLAFWKHALRRSVDSPLYGSGFDPYPADLIPPKTTVADDPFLGPHNSFVALGYRLGFIPMLILLVLLGKLVFAGYAASINRKDRRERAVCSALTSVVVYIGVVSAFNVFLEAPYAGPLFWTAVGLLAVAVYSDRRNEASSSAASEPVHAR